MPNMASIQVMKSDETTGIWFDQMSAAAGDGVPAVWRQTSGQPGDKPAGFHPMVKVLTKWNGPKTARQVQYEIVFPFATKDTSSGLWSSTNRVVFTGVATYPQAIPSGDLGEAAYQLANLMGHTLFKQIGATQYAPT